MLQLFVKELQEKKKKKLKILSFKVIHTRMVLESFLNDMLGSTGGLICLYLVTEKTRDKRHTKIEIIAHVYVALYFNI